MWYCLYVNPTRSGSKIRSIEVHNGLYYRTTQIKVQPVISYSSEQTKSLCSISPFGWVHTLFRQLNKIHLLAFFGSRHMRWYKWIHKSFKIRSPPLCHTIVYFPIEWTFFLPIRDKVVCY